MTRIQTLLLGTVAAAVVGGGAVVEHVRAQVVTPRPDELRFEAVLSEPIAAPGRRGVLAGTSALLVKDARTGQCYLAVTVGNSLGLAPASCAP